MVENIPRVLPTGLQAVIQADTWQWPRIFSWLQEQGNIDTFEMYRTFNCGIGMVICIDPGDKSLAQEVLLNAGEDVFEIGAITNKPHPEDITVLIK